MTFSALTSTGLTPSTVLPPPFLPSLTYNGPKVLPPEQAGFMPLRGDFEHEFDNGAETLVKDIAFNDEDTEIEQNLKLAMVDMYQRKLEIRRARKKTVREHGLLDLKRLQALEKKRSADEREVREKLKPFARFNSFEKHEKLVQSFCFEQRLRARLAQLCEYRQNGIRTLAAGEIYDAEKQKVMGGSGKKSRKMNVSSLWNY